MKINKIFGIQILLAGFLFFLGSGAQAQSGDPVGLILSTSGNVTAEAEDGTERRLRRRSPIYEGDTVITAARSRAQIRFNDNGLVALQPETSFLVEEHTFNGQEDGTESAVYRLFRGGLQAITGLIGNTNKDRYRFETPLATIGLRGTHWAATYCSTSCNGLAPGLYGGVAEGGIDVCNAGGCEPIDQDGYFYVQDQNTSPRILVRKPSVVFEDTTSDRDEEEQEEEGDSEEGSGEEGDSAQGDGNQEGENEGGDADGTNGDDSENDATQFGSGGGPDQGSEGGPGGADENLGQDFSGLDESDPVNCSNAPNSANPCESGSGDDEGEDNRFSITQLQSGEAQRVIEDRVTETDADGDGIPDAEDAFPMDANNWTDLDGDGFGDQTSDAFPGDANNWTDLDGDGFGDQTDDAFPGDANNWTDLDGDGFGDQTDDLFPQDPTEHADLDSDGLGDNSDPYPAFVTEEAASGSAVVLAGGNSALEGFNALIEPNGQTVRLVLTEQGSVGNVYLDAVDTENCAPSCEIEVVSGELIESGGMSNFGGAGFGVNWGLWDLEQSGASLNGTSFDVGPNLHYGYTDNLMTDAEYETFVSPHSDTGMTPMVIDYSLAGGTSPTDQNGQLGTLNNASMTFDLYMQMVTAFSLDLDIGNLNYAAELFQPTSLMDESLLLVGRVNGVGSDDYRYSLWGDTSLTLIGDEAEGVLGSYNLRHVSEGFSIFSRPEFFTSLLPANIASGVYVLEQDGIVTSPNYYSGGLPFVAPQPDSRLVFALHESCFNNCEGPSGYAEAWGDIYYGSESESFGLVTINGHGNVPTMIPFSYEEENLLNINSGLLLDANSHSFGSGASVNYGRWYAQDAFYLGEMYGYSMLPNLHYGYTEDFYADTPAATDSIINYQLVGGTAPTDEMGRSGHLHSVNLALDFHNNTVASFDLALTIEDRFYRAFMNGGESYDLSSLTSDIFIDLSGFCRGGDCGGRIPMAGYSSLNLVGENTSAGLAEGLLGNFVLNAGYYGEYYGETSVSLGCEGECGYFPYDISTLPSVTGVFVLEQYESPLLVNANTSIGSLQTAAFVGATSFLGGQAESFGALITPFTAGLAPSETEPLPLTEVLSGDIHTASLQTVRGVSLDSVVGATLENGTGISMEDGSLVRFGVYQNNGVQAHWGNWIGDMGITEPNETMAPYLHYLFTNDWSTSLPDVPVDQLEVFYHYAGGPSPADHRGYLGSVYDTGMTVNFGTAMVTDFWSSFAIDGAEYNVYFDDYDDIQGVDIYGVAIEQQGGIWGANIPLDGYCYYCRHTNGESFYPNLYGDASVAFAGDDAQTVLGTLAVGWEDYDSLENLVTGGATQSFILDREPVVYIDENTDSGLFVQANNGTAAVANLIDDAGTYSSIAGFASTANGDAIELFKGDQDTQLAVSGYATADASSLIEEGGLARFGYSQIGKYQDAEVYWGMWNALQDFTLNGSPENALDFLPFAYSENLTTGPFPSVPTGTMSSEADWVDYSNHGPSSFMDWGSAVNSAGQISDYIDVHMGVDFTTGTIVSFDFYTEFPAEDGYYGYDSYEGYFYGEGQGAIDLTGADLSNIVIPLEGSCSYCVAQSYSDMQGYTRLAFIGEQADGAIGSVSLVSGSYDESNVFTENGQASLAAAYVLEQYFYDRFYQSVYDQSVAAPAGAIALGASIVDTLPLQLGLGSLALSGAAESGIELVTLEDSGYTMPNAVVAGEFVGGSAILGGSDILSLNLDEGELDYYDNAVDSDAGYEAYWGRWLSYDQVELDGNVLDASGFHYFAYSDDLTDVNSIAPEVGVLEYGLYDSSNPTDQDGYYGFLQDVYMAIDFATQSITDFNMALYTNNTGNWAVSMTENSVALNGSAVSRFEVSGTVDGVATAAGNVNTAIIGNNADAVIGAYNLSDTVFDYEVIGNFLLKEGLVLPP